MYIFMRICWLLPLVILGCATPDIRDQPVTSENYRQKISINKVDTSFFLAKYVGTEKNCFPPITNRDCSERGKLPVYKPVEELSIEEFSLRFSHGDLASSKAKEYLFLSAADIALQRGYEYFTIMREYDQSTCGTFLTASTVGSVSGRVYTGSTTVHEGAHCSSSRTIFVLAFNDRDILSKGIFERVNAWKVPVLRPVDSLYFGSMTGLDKARFVSYETDKFSNVSSSFFVTTPNNAWKSVYSAQGMSNDLRAKLDVTDRTAYSFTDEAIEQMAKQQGDLIERNLIK